MNRKILPYLHYLIQIRDKKFNITCAALEMEISQPAVSKQVDLLENHFGTIFIRNGKRLLAFTPLGQTLCEIAEDMETHIERLFEISDIHTQNRWR